MNARIKRNLQIAYIYARERALSQPFRTPFAKSYTGKGLSQPFLWTVGQVHANLRATNLGVRHPYTTVTCDIVRFLTFNGS